MVRKTGRPISVRRYACSVPTASYLGGFEPFALLSAEGVREGLGARREVRFGGLVVFAAVVFASALIALFLSSPESSDSDSSEGGGGSERPPTPPHPPLGDVPLDDARPARVRLRDDRSLVQRLPVRQRRSAREPARAPVPNHRPGEDATGSPRTRSRSPETGRAFATGESEAGRRPTAVWLLSPGSDRWGASRSQ